MSEKKQFETKLGLDQLLYSSDKQEGERYYEVLMNAQGLVWRLLGDQENADQTKINIVAEQLANKVRAGELHRTVLERFLEYLSENNETESPTYKAVKQVLQELDK